MADSPKNRDAKARIPNLRGLKEFSESTDREAPVAFVGRKDQIDSLARDLCNRRRQWQGWGGPGFPPAWEGATWLFQGAPGAGKTSLLRRLESLKIEGCSRNKKGDLASVNVCVLTDQTVLHNPRALKKRIADSFIPGAAGMMEGTDAVQAGGGAKAGVRFAGAEASVNASEAKTRQRAGLVWEDFTREVREKPEQYPPLLLMVDEAQALGDEAAPQALWLHQGNDGLPIVPVFGGLAWLEERFGELGISRFSGGRVHTLEALSHDECREAVREFLRIYRVAGVNEAGEKWERRVATDCQGWPQHLQVGLQALAGALVESEGDLKEVDENAAVEGAAKRRKSYYQARLKSMPLQGKRHLTAAVVACLPPGSALTADELADIVTNIHNETVSSGASSVLRLPEGYSRRQFVKALVKAGILHEDEDGYLSIPIPSFRDFLLEQYPAPDQGEASGKGKLPSPAP